MFARAGAQVDRELAGAAATTSPGERRRLAAITRPVEARQAARWPATSRWREHGDRGAADLEYRFEADMDAATAGAGAADGGLAGGDRRGPRGDASARLASTGCSGWARWPWPCWWPCCSPTGSARAWCKPLQQLASAARSLAAGKLGHRVAINSTSELNEVGGTFNAMAEALERQREELERHAFADSLTGLANRALFEDRARHALERAAGGDERVAVLVLDMDGFKLVNDGLGHACGDELLQARRRAHGARAAAVGHARPARLGRVRGAARERARARRRARRRGAAAPAPSASRSCSLAPRWCSRRASGSPCPTGATRDEAELLRRADLAMYRVKQRGRNACEFFDPAMDDQAAERLEMVNALRRAVDRDELVVHYQPIMDLDSGRDRGRPRRCCAGTGPGAGSWRRSSSSHWRRRPV